MAAAKITVQNVVQPGKTYQVDAAKYAEMRARVLEALPDKAPGMKVADLIDTLRPRLDPGLFPGGATAGWWVKCVQLDLEAKGVIVRHDKAPVQLWRRG
jgi:hypothetical protein